MAYRLKKLMIMAAALVLLLQTGFLSAQEQPPETERPRPTTVTHILGDNAVAFSIGALIPLFFVKTVDGTVEATNLYIGVKGSIEYFTYLSNSVTIGAEINGGFTFTPNFNIYWTLPICAKISYIIYLGDFQLFLSLSAGVTFERFLEGTRMDFIARPSVAFYIPIDPSLSLGLSVAYWFVPQMASAEQEATKAGQSRLGNFLDTSISLIYHF